LLLTTLHWLLTIILVKQEFKKSIGKSSGAGNTVSDQ
jgi:hypothetical protein